MILGAINNASHSHRKNNPGVRRARKIAVLFLWIYDFEKSDEKSRKYDETDVNDDNGTLSHDIKFEKLIEAERTIAYGIFTNNHTATFHLLCAIKIEPTACRYLFTRFEVYALRIN